MYYMIYNGKKYGRNDGTGLWHDSNYMQVPKSLQNELEACYEKEYYKELERKSLLLPGGDEPNASICHEIRNDPENRLSIVAKNGRVELGSYPQGADGGVAPIVWLVLNEDNEKMVLMSEFCLDTLPLFKRGEDQNGRWYASRVRAWLNTEFLKRAFSEHERDLLKRCRLEDGSITDVVSLISERELDHYLPPSHENRKAFPTPYARKKGVGKKDVSPDTYWWIRSRSTEEDTRAYWWTRECGETDSLSVSPYGEKQRIANAKNVAEAYESGGMKVGIRPVIMIRKSIKCGAEDEESFLFFRSEPLPNKRVLYIYKGNIRCRRFRHPVIQATAIMHGISKGGTDDEEIAINAEYCMKCKKLMLNDISYQEYRRRYRFMIGDLRMLSDSFEGEYALSEESPLKLSGYNVGQQDNFDARTRQYILASIIYEKIMTKGEVIQYLEFFIRQNASKDSHRIACGKWREDLKFVQEYNISVQPKIAVLGVKRYGSDPNS